MTDTQQVGGNTFSTATVQPPGSPAAAASCQNAVSARITVTWTATTTTFADGYDVLRSTTSGSGYSVIGHVDGRTTTTFVDSGRPLGRTYFYVVRATAGNWLSANSTQTSATTPLVCV